MSKARSVGARNLALAMGASSAVDVPSAGESRKGPDSALTLLIHVDFIIFGVTQIQSPVVETQCHQTNK
jgi:hypothetical protein